MELSSSTERNIMLHIFTNIRDICICTKYANQQLGMLRVAIMKPRVLLAVFRKCITQSLPLLPSTIYQVAMFLNIFQPSHHSLACELYYGRFYCGRWLGEAFEWFLFHSLSLFNWIFNSDGSQYNCAMENEIKMLRV